MHLISDKRWERELGDYFEIDGGPKLVLDQIAVPFPEMMDDSLNSAYFFVFAKYR
jgi:hypothetical protein